MKALAEIGWARAARFGFFTLAMVPYRLALFPQLRAPWLRLLGARIGRRTVLHDVRFFHLYRRGLAGLDIGDECFLGDECLLDLAEAVRATKDTGRHVEVASFAGHFADELAQAADVSRLLTAPDLRPFLAR